MGPRASSGSLVCGVRVPKILGLLPTHWQVKSNSGVSAILLAGRADSYSLAAGPRDPTAHFRSLVRVGADTVGYGVYSVPKVVLAC